MHITLMGPSSLSSEVAATAAEGSDEFLEALPELHATAPIIAMLINTFRHEFG